jgi:hypothetical protein
MAVFDFYFHYKHIGRFILLNKFSLEQLNTYKFFNFVKAVSFFSIKNLENFDDMCVSNYFFFMFFFLGRQSYILNYTSVFHLGITYYNFFVQCIFVKRFIFYILSFVLIEMVVGLSKDAFISDNICYLQFFIKDVSIFIEKKTISGLFSLRHTLNIRFFFLAS